MGQKMKNKHSISARGHANFNHHSPPSLINIPLTRTAAEGEKAEFFTLLLTSSAR
jgi:hypothetical protein